MLLFLHILKIIGIILASILCTVLVLLILILFVPLRYKIEGHKDDEDAAGKVRVTWLLSFIGVKILYSMKDGLSVLVRILFFTVYRQPKAVRKDKAKKKIYEAASDTVSDNEEESGKERSEDPAEDVPRLETREKAAENKDKKRVRPKENVSECRADNKNGSEEKASGPGFGEKLSALTAKLKVITDAASNEQTKAAFKKLMSLVVKLLKHICPRKGKAQLDIGFDDPSLTGQILAVYSMLYPAIGKRIHLSPDFDNSRIDIDADMSGRICVAVILIIGLKIYFGKDFKYLKKEIANVREG